MNPRRLPPPPGARPGSVVRDGDEILVICGRTGRAYTVARPGTYRGAGHVHGWPWGTLEGIVRSHGFVHGPRGWATVAAEREAARAEGSAVEQLDLTGIMTRKVRP